MRQLNEVNVVIRHTPSSKPLIVHIDKLQHYQGALPACWATVPSPKDQAAAIGPAAGPGPSAVPIQPDGTGPDSYRTVRRPAKLSNFA